MATDLEDLPRKRDPRIAWEGCSVLLDINDGDRVVFARLTPSSTLKVGSKKCSLRPLIGCPFGSLFHLEVGPSGVFLSRDFSKSPGSHLQEIGAPLANSDTRDNRSLVDNNKAQGLSGEDIEALRRGGATGDQIVEALIANSSTFDKKTSFSQDKYRIRKQKKYAPKVLMRRPFTRSICEAYFQKHPEKIGFLRMDTLSLLLSMGNVGAFSDVLLVDMVGGMLTGAVAERLAGTGSVCNTYFGSKPYSSAITGIFNFDDETRRRIFCMAVSDLHSVEDNTFQNLIAESDLRSSNAMSDIDDSLQEASNGSAPMDHEGVIHEDGSHASSLLQSAGDNGDVDSSEKKVNLGLRSCSAVLSDDTCESNDSAKLKTPNEAKYRKCASPEVVESWKQNGFTSLIVAAPELDPWHILEELLPLLSYSAPFAIYHQYLQPLAACMHKIQTEKMAVGLRISEPWLREYQVLPSRTHPAMQMSAFGGYILNGIRICRENASVED